MSKRMIDSEVIEVKDFFQMQQWGWKTSGTMIGLVIVMAVMLVKPVGVSTQFVIFDGILWSFINPEMIQESAERSSGYSSLNAYLDALGGKYAKDVAKPLNYGLVFVVSMVAGGFVSRKLRAESTQTDLTGAALLRQQRFGTSVGKRYLAALVGGILVLYGARLAGGCTSGHMMSGMMQTSYSSYVFTLAVFLVAIPAALLLYRDDLSQPPKQQPTKKQP